VSGDDLDTKRAYSARVNNYWHGGKDNFADVRDIDEVLARAGQTLDLGQPVAVFLSSLLHLIPDADDPYGIVRRAMGAVPSGSHLAIVHPASDIRPEASTEMAARLNELVAQQRTYRSRAEVTAFFDGLPLVPPGVVPVPQWRPDSEMAAKAPTMAWCGMGRNP
jgi:S-adenosyl methyltransferase